jgi:uncharacterized protein YjbI with pentapeptide repeats
MSSHAAEDFHAELLAGRPVRFARPAANETAEEASARTMPAAWIEALIPDVERMCSVPILIEHAIIEGPIEKDFAEFKYDVVFQACEFRGILHLRGAVFHRRCNFTESLFRRDVKLNGITVPFELGLLGAVFEGTVWLDDARIGTFLTGSGAEFHSVYMERIRARTMHFRTRRVNEDLHPTIFHDKARFHDCVVDENVDLDGAQFRGDVNFSRLHVGANLYARTPDHDDKLLPITGDRPTITFAQRAVFREMKIGGSAIFAGVQFSGPVDFDLATIGADLLFLELSVGADVHPNVFGADVLMRRVSVAGRTVFSVAHFIGELHLRHAELAGPCFFVAGPNHAHPPIFDTKVDFRLARIGGSLEFTGGSFGGSVDFHGMHIGGDFEIYEAAAGRTAHFKESVDCSGTAIEGSLEWRCPQFAKNVNFNDLSCGRGFAFGSSSGPQPRNPRIGGSARFNGARVGSEIHLQGATFDGSLNFYGVRCPLVLLSGATIAQGFSLIDAHLSTLRLGELGSDGSLRDLAALGAGVDLRGAHFERLSADVMTLARLQDPYDRSVYETLETHLRKTGNDREAGNVYYVRKRRESRALRHRVFSRKHRRRLRERLTELPSVVADFLSWSVYRYGVRPLRLLTLSVMIVMLGTLVFARPGAVEPKEKAGQIHAPLSAERALGYSLRLFIPVVELPTGDDLRPSKRDCGTVCSLPLTFDGYAVLHRLAGAILVPLGVAALAGILVRKPRS